MYVHTYIFGRPFVTVRPMLSDRCPVCPVLFVCNVGVLWPNGWMDEDATWYGGRPRPRRHCSSKTGTQPPSIFGQCLLGPNGRSSQLLLSYCKNNVRTLELCCVPSSSSVALVFVGCYVILLLSAAGSPPAIYSYYQQRAAARETVKPPRLETPDFISPASAAFEQSRPQSHGLRDMRSQARRCLSEIRGDVAGAETAPDWNTARNPAERQSLTYTLAPNKRSTDRCWSKTSTYFTR